VAAPRLRLIRLCLLRALLQLMLLLLTPQILQVLDLLRQFPLWFLLLLLAHICKKVSTSQNSTLMTLFDMV
jgi:hypothetical protein